MFLSQTSNGFNILICGSSRITETHIKVLKKIKFCKIKYIFGEDKKKISDISKKYNIEICDNLNNSKLKECNLAVITSATHKHHSIIKKLANIISNFVVEKPIVANIKELEDLVKLNHKSEINLLEVSQNIFCPELKKYKNKVNKLQIVINKKRQIKDYYNFKNQIDKSKSPIMSQIPHWYDVSLNLIGKPLFLEKIIKKKINILSPFNDYYEILLVSEDKKKDLLIKLNYASDTNQSTKIIFDNTIINFEDKKYIKIFKILLNKINPNMLYFFNDKNFFKMYQSFMSKIKKNKKIDLFNYYEKTKLLDRLNLEI